jgi:uncharacterized membrane protein
MRDWKQSEGMETRFKVLGHPVHPVLIVLPIGLFSIAAICDLAYLATGNTDLAVVAYWNIGVGIVGGLLAAVFGLIDWLGIPAGTRAKQVGLWHGIGNVVIVGMMLASWLLRPGDGGYAPDVVPAVLSVLAVALALVTAWLGGELVYRLRVGVDSDAHLDASSSLDRDGLVAAGGSTDSPGSAAR